MAFVLALSKASVISRVRFMGRASFQAIGCSGTDERRDLGTLDVTDVVYLQGSEALADGEQIVVREFRVDVAYCARCVLRRARGVHAVFHLDLEGRGDVGALCCHKASSFRGTAASPERRDSWYRAPAAGRWSMQRTAVFQRLGRGNAGEVVLVGGRTLP